MYISSYIQCILGVGTFTDFRDYIWNNISQELLLVLFEEAIGILVMVWVYIDASFSSQLIFFSIFLCADWLYIICDQMAIRLLLELLDYFLKKLGG